MSDIETHPWHVGHPETEKEQAGERGAGESRDKRSLKRKISQASSAVSSATIDDDGEEDSENVKEEVVALRDSYIKKGVEKADSENGEEDSDEIDVLDEFLEAPSKDDQWVAMTVSHTKKKPIEKTELTNGEAIAKDEVAKAKSIDPSKRRAQAMQIAKEQPRKGCLTADTRGQELVNIKDSVGLWARGDPPTLQELESVKKRQKQMFSEAFEKLQNFVLFGFEAEEKTKKATRQEEELRQELVKAEEELRQKLEVEEGGKKTKALQSKCEEKNKKSEKEQHKKSPFDF